MVVLFLAFISAIMFADHAIGCMSSVLQGLSVQYHEAHVRLIAMMPRVNCANCGIRMVGVSYTTKP